MFRFLTWFTRNKEPIIPINVPHLSFDNMLPPSPPSPQFPDMYANNVAYWEQINTKLDIILLKLEQHK